MLTNGQLQWRRHYKHAGQRGQQTEVSEDDVSEEFRQKVAAWEKAGLFDEIVAMIDEAIEKLDREEVG